MKEALSTVSRGFDNMNLINLNIPTGMLNGPADLLLMPAAKRGTSLGLPRVFFFFFFFF